MISYSLWTCLSQCRFSCDTPCALSHAQVLNAMKPSACLLNVGRGAIVDEAALVKSLEAGSIAGAYLDVFEHEPLPADSTLWRLPNVILSPHDSASCIDNAERVQSIFKQNAECFVNGGNLANVVWSSIAQPAARL